MSSNRSIAREIGAALAVLAIYLLTLLAPLHYARASQLAFDALGFSSLTPDWSICSLSPEGNPDQNTSPAKCAVSGLAKQALTPPTTVLGFAGIAVAAPAQKPARSEQLHPAATPPTGLRGPPVLV